MKKNNQENLPSHVAIVPDGNRRWARKRGMAPWRGHLKGAEMSKEQLETALELGIYCVTLWGGSWKNLTERPKVEIKWLFKIYETYFKKLLKAKEVYENEVKVSILGRWKDILPPRAKDAAQKLMEATKNYNNRFLNLMIAYDGQDEMLEGIRGVAKELKTKSVKVNENALKKHLWSGLLPPVDLLIRTGSSQDPHNSAGFMMWHTANSQLYFPKGFYPDFGKKEFIKAIQEYQRRERRLGK